MPTETTSPKPRRSQRKKPGIQWGKLLLCLLRRTLLVIFTAVVLAFVAVVMVCNLIFNGPSETARNRLTMSMLESSGMKWCPALFIGEDTVEDIQRTQEFELPDEQSDVSQIKIDLSGSLAGSGDEWKDYPDGIRIETVQGDTYTAHVMIIRDPSKVYMATSSDKFSRDVPGTRITNEIETEGAIAAINAGAFFDNGTAGKEVGSTPEGLVIAGGEVVWNSGSAPEEGFAGFNQDNILVVAKTMTAKKAKELGIRDGCCFGPVLIMNGEVNEEAYNTNSGLNPRTAIGQRADGAVIFLCIDGRQMGSLGGTYGDIINIMVEYGAVNACNLDGGSSSVMLYRDNYGRYGEAGKVQMINSYSLLQQEPRRMPTFFMVAPGSEE